MQKRGLTFVAIAAIVIGFFPTEGSCALIPTVDHSCCAVVERTTSGSCCDPDPGPAPPKPSDGVDLCNCAHPASNPAVVAAETAPRSDTTDAWPACDPKVNADRPTSSAHAPDATPTRPWPPPPAYLVNCAFLT
jgi:hypothetical protein